jgi:hypothetical protein
MTQDTRPLHFNFIKVLNWDAFDTTASQENAENAFRDLQYRYDIEHVFTQTNILSDYGSFPRNEQWSFSTYQYTQSEVTTEYYDAQFAKASKFVLSHGFLLQPSKYKPLKRDYQNEFFALDTKKRIIYSFFSLSSLAPSKDVTSQKYVDLLNLIIKTYLDPLRKHMNLPTPQEMEQREVQKFATQIYKLRVAENESAYRNAQSYYNQYVSQAQAEHVKLITATVQLEAFKAKQKEMLTEFSKSLVDIRKLPFVKEMRMENNTINVDIDAVLCAGIQVGDYTVSVTTSGVSIKNRDSNRNIGGNPHPHISTGNTICWGSEQELLVRNLIAAGKYKEVIMQAFSFLKHYNHDSPYRDLVYWKMYNYKSKTGVNKPFTARDISFIKVNYSSELATYGLDPQQRLATTDTTRTILRI